MPRRPEPRGWTIVATGLAVAVLGLAACAQDGPVPSAVSASRPSVVLYRAPQAIDQYVAGHPALSVIAREAQFTWLGEHDGPDVVRHLVADARGRLLPLVLYAIPHRDTGSHSAGGFSTTAEYAAWVTSVATAIGDAPAIVVVEPDAVGQSLTLDPDARGDRLTTLRAALATLRLNAPGARVYLDASTWIPVHAMADLLVAAGVSQANGVSLNVANYRADAEVFAYGNALSRLIGGRHYIVDTSRNGRGVGPDPRAWCNVAGRALGARPGTLPSSQPLVDGLFWIKHPGVSDGSCNGGPPAGVVWPAMAEELVVNALEDAAR